MKKSNKSSIFSGCSSLVSIDLPDGITDIPRSAFAYCTALASVDFPDSLESIQMYAFRGCESLTELYFPSDLSVIYTYAFAECTGLTYIRLPAVEASIRENNFLESTEVTTIEYPEGCTGLYTGDSGGNGFTVLSYAKTLILPSTLTFADGLSTIGDEAFYGCRDSVITLPDSVKSIGTDAFYTIDNSLTIYCVTGSYVESYAIENGISYVSTEKEDDDGDAENGNDDGGTQKSGSSTGAQKGKKYTVGNAVYKVTSSNTATYVSPVKKSLTKVTIPASVKINGKNYKVTAVSASAFAKMTKLKTVVIGKNVKTIGKKAFYNCKNLKKVTIKSKVLKTIGKKAFKGIAKKAVIKVPKAKKTAYKKLLKKSGISSAIKVK